MCTRTGELEKRGKAGEQERLFGNINMKLVGGDGGGGQLLREGTGLSFILKYISIRLFRYTQALYQPPQPTAAVEDQTQEQIQVRNPFVEGLPHILIFYL